MLEVFGKTKLLEIVNYSRELRRGLTLAVDPASNGQRATHASTRRVNTVNDRWIRSGRLRFKYYLAVRTAQCTGAVDHAMEG